jgi:hypothetical protein
MPANGNGGLGNSFCFKIPGSPYAKRSFHPLLTELELPSPPPLCFFLFVDEDGASDDAGAGWRVLGTALELILSLVCGKTS